MKKIASVTVTVFSIFCSAITITLSLPCIAAVTVISQEQEMEVGATNPEQDDAKWTPDQLMQSLRNHPEVRQADKDNPRRYSYAVGYAKRYWFSKHTDPSKPIVDNWANWVNSFNHLHKKRLEKQKELGHSDSIKNKKYRYKAYKRE